MTHFGLGALGHFILKNQTKFIKFFELYQVFTYAFMCQTYIIHKIYKDF